MTDDVTVVTTSATTATAIVKEGHVSVRGHFMVQLI
jgi:hypothetical protein